MQLRNKPFGEWVLIYFDKSKITEAELLNLTKTRGCKRAAVIRDRESKAGNTSAVIINPFICAGDTVALKISSDGKDKISLELPKGWKVSIPETINGSKTVFIQTPASTAQGKQVLKLKSGSSTAELVCNTVRKIQ